ncbi:MAG: filamentous hemagglutinin N-terminal domain-containing protein [Proteobacteria bacterium]|nr:filamentous hemagglutinin N-terminal domain-containing protein [Pseudomonadota bacterium]
MKQHHTRVTLLSQPPRSIALSHFLFDNVNHAAEKFKRALIPVGSSVSVLILLSILTANPSYSMPQNGAVVGGAAIISQPNPATMNINQTSGTAIINWHGYNIGANESVRYIQPGSSSILLNRVTGGDPSYIYGLLSGNGQVWVINPNGLLVGPGATVQTGSFLASTMNISNENFLSGKHIFTSAPDSTGSVVNQGSISAAQGGYVVLAGPSVTNSGSIVANVGSVHLAAGDTVTLSLDNGNLINVAVNGDVAANSLGATNTGYISANGGQVVLTARVAGDVMKSVVNNKGIIEAKSIADKNGIISLDGGDHGITAQSGTLVVSGKKSGETGGTIKILGDKVGLFAGSSIDASGDAGGGTVLIGGNFHGAGAEKNASMTYVDKDAAIQADARATGNGGKVAVWADDVTRFYGAISAKGGALGGDGGFAEVSGKQSLTFDGSVNTSAQHGAMGTLLLDPDDITILASDNTYSGVKNLSTGIWGVSDDTPGSQTIGDQYISTLLTTTSLALQATNSITANTGVAINWDNTNALTLAAGTNMTLNNASFASPGTLHLNFGQGNASGTLALGTSNLTGVGTVNLTAGDGTSPGDYSISRAGGNSWNLTGADTGNITGVGAAGGALAFSNVGNLVDTGTGTFNMGTTGSVTGAISAVGGTLDYGSWTTSAVTFDLGTGASSGTGGTSGVTTVKGKASNALTNTIQGGTTYTLTGANAGGNGTVNWTDFGKLNASSTVNFGSTGSVTGVVTAPVLDYSSWTTSAVTFDLGTGASSGTGGTSGVTTVKGKASNALTNTIQGGTTYTLTGANAGGNGTVNWTDFGKLNASSTVNFGSTGSVTGAVTAPTFDYSSYGADVTVVLAGAKTGTATGIGGSFDGVSAIDANPIKNNTMSGTGQTYNLTAPDAGNSGGLFWTSFKKIADNGTGTIATTDGQTYNLTGANAGSVDKLLPGGYTNIGNLTDTGAGDFKFGPAGGVSGNINAASGTLDYTGRNADVDINLAGTAKSTTGIGGAWSGIANIIGSSGAADTMGGINTTYNLTGPNAGNSNGVSWTSFENLHDTAAGIFKFADAGRVSGGVIANGGTLDYSDITGPVTVDLTAHKAPGIDGTWNGITTVAGSIHSDTITGSNQTYNLTGVDTGNNGSTSWSSFENITGVAGTNSYSGAVGSLLSGAIIDTGSGVTVQGNIQTGGEQSYLGPVKLAAATTLTSTGSGAITFARTVASDSTPRDLTVGTSGVTTFNGAVGATPLNSLTVNPGGTTHINGGSVTTSGAAGQTYNNAVVLGDGTILNAGPGAITEGSSASLTTAGLLTTLSGSGQNLVGNGTNSVAAFNATNTTSGDINLTNRSPLLTITGINQTGGGLSITNSGAITSSAPLTVTGATTITAAGHSVTLTDADNDFSGSVTVTAAATDINDRNDLTAVLNTTGPTTLTAGADMTLSGTSTDSVSATAVDTVTLSNPAASILHITGATIDGTMDNSSPIDLTTTSRQTPITVNLTGGLPFLTYAGDVKTNIQSLGTYNGAVIMGTELDHYKATIDVKAATTALIVATERMGVLGMLARFDEYFNIAPMESIIDDTGAFIAPEAEPTLIDR